MGSALPWLAAFLVPVAVHLVFGLDDVGLVEEWGVNLRFDDVGGVFWAPSDPVLRGQSIRPLTVAPHSLAYLLTPDTFVGYHLIHAAALGLKGVAMFGLLRRLAFAPMATITGALVFALFPAWDGLFTFRTIHIQLAVGLFVLATDRLLAFHRRPTWPGALAIVVPLVLSLLLYEVAYVAVVLAPAMLLLLGRPRPRPLALTLAVWFIAPLLNGIRILVLIASDQPLYQGDIVTQAPRHPWRELTELIGTTIGGGLGGFVNPPSGFTATNAVLLVTVLTCGVIWFASRQGTSGDDRSGRIEPLSPVALCLLVAGSLVASPLVALVYWPNQDQLTDPLRIFSIASVPLALAVAAGIELLGRRLPRSPQLVVCSILVLVVLTSGVGQRTAWHQHSLFQEHLYGAILAAIPHGYPTGTFIIVDTAPITNRDVYTVIPEILNQSIDLLLPGDQLSIVCNQALDVMGADDGVAPLAPGQCLRGEGTVRSFLTSVPLGTSTVIEIRRTTDGAGWTGGPVALPWERATAVLGCVASGTCDDGEHGVQARLLQGPDGPALRSEP